GLVFFSSRRRHTRSKRDWSSDVCSSDLPIYGGQAYGIQLSGLRRGAQIIVGTPGRVIDHLKKGTLDLSGLRHLVLDEADEMLAKIGRASCREREGVGGDGGG